MADKNCVGKNKAGQRCKATKQSGSDYCFFHDPEKKAQRETANSRGGQATAKLSREILVETLIGEVVDLQDPGQVNTGNEINTLEDLHRWILIQMNYTEQNKKYAILSMADRTLQLKYAEFLFKVIVLGTIEPRMQELEAILNREG